jgi:hypothetical protein
MYGVSGRHIRHDWDGEGRRRMYFATVDWLTEMPGFTSSPWIRGASGYGSSLNGLKTFRPGRLKSRSFPVAMMRPYRRAVAAM